jgi:hypothetical protein
LELLYRLNEAALPAVPPGRQPGKRLKLLFNPNRSWIERKASTIASQPAAPHESRVLEEGSLANARGIGTTGEP